MEGRGEGLLVGGAFAIVLAVGRRWLGLELVAAEEGKEFRSGGMVGADEGRSKFQCQGNLLKQATLCWGWCYLLRSFPVTSHVHVR